MKGIADVSTVLIVNIAAAAAACLLSHHIAFFFSSPFRNPTEERNGTQPTLYNVHSKCVLTFPGWLDNCYISLTQYMV